MWDWPLACGVKTKEVAMFNQAKFKRVFKESGLTKSELASLYGVSRQTVYDWHTGASAPTQKALATRESLYTSGLASAIDRGVLPIRVKDAKLRKERVLAMAQRLHELTKPK